MSEMIALSVVYLADLALQRILTHAFMFIMERDKGVKKKKLVFHINI